MPPAMRIQPDFRNAFAVRDGGAGPVQDTPVTAPTVDLPDGTEQMVAVWVLFALAVLIALRAGFRGVNVGGNVGVRVG